MNVRIAREADIPSACRLLNDIIDIGGTTAIEKPLSETEFSTYFLDGPDCVVCHVCEGLEGDILGFQALAISTALPEGWVDIATFARSKPKVRGVGSALFQSTREFVAASDARTINATIRADNVPGLSYYSKTGFVDYDVRQAVPLMDGSLVDRICKRFDL